MAIAFRSSSSAFAQATSVVVTKPAGVVNGDVLVAVALSDGAAVTPPAGWSGITGGGALNMYYKTAASEPANYTWTTSANNIISAIISAYSGATGVVDKSNVTGSGSSTTPTAVAITTTNNNEMIVWAAANGVITDETTDSCPSAMTKRQDIEASYFDGFVNQYTHLWLGDAVLAIAGLTNSTFNNGSSTPSHTWAASILSLIPAITSNIVTIPLGTLTLQALIPVINIAQSIVVPLGTMTLQGLQIQIQGIKMVIPLGTLTLRGLILDWIGVIPVLPHVPNIFLPKPPGYY